MRSRPEKRLEGWYFKCLIPDCEESYGHNYISYHDADIEWYSHLQIKHPKVKNPTHIVKRAKFRRVKKQ